MSTSPSPPGLQLPDRGPAAVSPSSGGGFPLWAKLLLGCGVVVLVFMIVSGVLLYWGVKRLTQPGRTLEARQVVSERSVGWVRIEPIADDPGMSELVKSLFLVLQRLGQQDQKEELPEWMRKWYELSQAQQGDNPALEWFLPREMTFAFEPGESAATETVAALNLGLLARAIGWITSLDEDDVRTRRVRGHRALVSEDQVTLFLDGTLLLAADLEAMERLLDRIEGEAGDGDAGSDPTLTVPGEDDWDLYGRIDNRRGDFEDTVTGLAEWLGADPTPIGGTVEEAIFRLDVVTAETLKAELTLDVTGDAAARAWLQALDEHRASIEDEVLDLELDRHATDRRVRAEWRLRGLDQWLARFLVTAFEEAERRGRAPEEDLPVEQPPGSTGGE